MASAASSTVKIRILFVDDSQLVRTVIKDLLMQSSSLWEISEADCAMDALQKIITVKPDLVILDVNLPDMQPSDVVRNIREQSPTAKIVMCSLSDPTDLSELTKQIGADACISKTARIEEFQKTLEALIN